MGYSDPGTGQIVVQTEACGVCHTDLHAANGDWPLKPKPPFIPGHEAIGIVCTACNSPKLWACWYARLTPPVASSTWRRSLRRPDHRAIAQRVQARCRHDPQTRHLRPRGLPPSDFPVALFDVVANCFTIRGSFVGTRSDMAEALDFAARGKAVEFK